jgi:hypothetical protein
MRQWETVWRKIGELEDAILDAAESHFGGREPQEGAVEEIDEKLGSLHNFRLVVASRAAELKRTIVSSNPPQLKSARAEYCHTVLAAWMAWGGELKLPSDGRSGPLARFFFAVVGPVIGRDQPSPASLRDIVAAFEVSRRLVIENTRALVDKSELPEASKTMWENYLNEEVEGNYRSKVPARPPKGT